MRFYFWLGALASAFVHPAQAAFQIIDPQGAVPQATAFLGQPEFASSFHVGDQMNGQSQYCKIQGGNEVCFPPIGIQSRVVKIEENQVTMLNRTGDDEDSDSEWVLSREVFERVQGNFIVLYLAEGLGGDVPGEKDFATIDSFEKGEFSLSDGSKVPSFTVAVTQNKWDSKTSSYQQSRVALTVGKGLPAVSQLLVVQPDPGILKTPIFKVVQVTRGN